MVLPWSLYRHELVAERKEEVGLVDKRNEDVGKEWR